MVPIRVAALAGLAGLLVPSLSGAATTVLWESTTADDFKAGTLEKVVLSSEGRLVAGRKVESLAADPATAIWSVLVASDGRTYFGTSPEGRILRRGDGKVETVADTDQVIVTSMVEGPDGAIYAATVPAGKVYRVLPDGTSSTFAPRG
jgi:hypothetical protein